jgi:hypothetical protein
MPVYFLLILHTYRFEQQLWYASLVTGILVVLVGCYAQCCHAVCLVAYVEKTLFRSLASLRVT